MNEANIWQPKSLIQVSGYNKIAAQLIVAEAGQTTFTLTDFAYKVNTGSLLIFSAGKLLTPSVEFHEVSDTSFHLTSPALAGTKIVAVAIVGIDNPGFDNFVLNEELDAAKDMLLQEIASLETTLETYQGSNSAQLSSLIGLWSKLTVASYTDLRELQPDGVWVCFARGKDTVSDSGAGWFYMVSEPALDNDDTIIVPTFAGYTGDWHWRKADVTSSIQSETYEINVLASPYSAPQYVTGQYANSAIQSAIDAASARFIASPSSNRVTVKIPSGYRFKLSLNVDSPLTLSEGYTVFGGLVIKTGVHLVIDGILTLDSVTIPNTADKIFLIHTPVAGVHTCAVSGSGKIDMDTLYWKSTYNIPVIPVALSGNYLTTKDLTCSGVGGAVLHVPLGYWTVSRNLYNIPNSQLPPISESVIKNNKLSGMVNHPAADIILCKYPRSGEVSNNRVTTYQDTDIESEIQVDTVITWIEGIELKYNTSCSFYEPSVSAIQDARFIVKDNEHINCSTTGLVLTGNNYYVTGNRARKIYVGAIAVTDTQATEWLDNNLVEHNYIVGTSAITGQLKVSTLDKTSNEVVKSSTVRYNEITKGEIVLDIMLSSSSTIHSALPKCYGNQFLASSYGAPLIRLNPLGIPCVYDNYTDKRDFVDYSTVGFRTLVPLSGNQLPQGYPLEEVRYYKAPKRTLSTISNRFKESDFDANDEHIGFRAEVDNPCVLPFTPHYDLGLPADSNIAPKYSGNYFSRYGGAPDIGRMLAVVGHNGGSRFINKYVSGYYKISGFISVRRKYSNMAFDVNLVVDGQVKASYRIGFPTFAVTVTNSYAYADEFQFPIEYVGYLSGTYEADDPTKGFWFTANITPSHGLQEAGFIGWTSGFSLTLEQL